MLLNFCLPGAYNLLEKKNGKTAITTQWGKNNSEDILSAKAIWCGGKTSESRWLERSQPLKDGQEFTPWQSRDENRVSDKEKASEKPKMWKNMESFLFIILSPCDILDEEF